MHVGTPFVIGQGDTWEKMGWGPMQFPAIGKTDDGKIIAIAHRGEDDEKSYEYPPYAFESSDLGKTWKEADQLSVMRSAPRLRNGERIGSKNIAPKITSGKEFEGARPVYTIKDYADIYDYDTMNQEYLPKKWYFNFLKPNAFEPEVLACDIKGWDHMPVIRPNGTTEIPFAFGRLRIAPDGTPWQMHYVDGLDPETGESTEGLAQYYFVSKDNGRSWELASWMDPRKTEGAYVFCESDIAWTGSGRAVTLMRGAKCFTALSDDGGYTWNKPVLFDDIGVEPSIVSLNCGAMLASYGRPGFFVRACLDPDGEKWEDRVQLIEANDKMLTCSYSDIVVLSDNEAMVVYSDFFHPGNDGIKRKTIMGVIITFE